MNFKHTVKNTILQAFNGKRVNNKKLTTSYVSLFLVFLILISGTISWFTARDTATVDSDTFSLEAASGLRLNEGEDLTNHIRLDKIKLDEASSVDGRNMFFPTSGSFTSNTSSMVFREGNVGDKNQKYLYKDFSLKGESGVTYVYVKSYTIKVGKETFNGSTGIQYDSSGKPVSQTKHDECPVRIAFISDSSEIPQVIDPTALVDNYVQKYNAVDSTDESGFASTAISDGLSFSDYYFVTGSPIFTLVGNTPVNVTMVVWLEGTENTKTGTSNSQAYANSEISIDIELESNWSDMDIVTFIDETIGDDVGYPAGVSPSHWINSSNDAIVIMSYTDSNSITRTVVMEEDGNYRWIAPIPRDVTTNISFYRYSLTDEIIYNAWHTKKDVNLELNPAIANDNNWIGYYGSLQEDRGSSLIYTAVRGNNYGKVADDDIDLEKKRLSPCLGYWNYTTPGTQPTTASATSPTSSSGQPIGDILLKIYAERLKGWVQSNLNEGYKLYVVFGDGTRAQLTGSGDYYKNESIHVKYGTQIKRFVLVNPHDNSEKVLSLADGVVVVTRDINITFQMQNDDTMKKL